MKTDVLTIKNNLKVLCDEGFREMADDEKSALSTIADGDFLAFSNPDKHMIITVGWKEIGSLASKLLNSKEIAKNMEKSIRKAMMVNGYALGRFKDREIAGQKAVGFDYVYEAKGIVMVGESYAIKIDKEIYYFHMYSRQTRQTENMKVWENLLQQLLEIMSKGQ